MSKNKREHLTLEDRCLILTGLEKGESFKAIANKIGCNASSVSREIRKHYEIDRKAERGRRFNDCKHKSHCLMTKAQGGGCEYKIGCRRTSCYNCSYICNPDTCSFYEKEECSRLHRPPYVCNNCKVIKGKSQSLCPLEKRFYKPTLAQEEYEQKLSNCRTGFHLKGEKKEEFELTLYMGIQKGQSIGHMFSVFESNPSFSTPISKSTVYNMINKGGFDSIKRLDLREAVTRRPRHNVSIPKKSNKYYIGRTYADYIQYVEEQEINVVQMDTVEGKKGGKVFLTLFFPNSNLQLLYVLESKTSECVVNVFRTLREELGIETYMRLFPVILTDRGTEFSNPYDIESDEDGNMLSKVFYCDAQRSDQKGGCERNHRELRKIFPKGKDITIDQEKTYIVASHLNCTPRPKLNNKTPYEVFKALYGEEILKKLGLFYVNPENVILKPCLLD